MQVMEKALFTSNHSSFMAQTSAFDLSVPMDDHTRFQIMKAMDKYGVCVFHGPALANDQHIEFARNFGPLQFSPRVDRGQSLPRLSQPELFDVSNLDENGDVLKDDDLRRVYARGNYFWHTDSSFNQKRAAYSMLHAHEVHPDSANTEFADMRAAYEELPQSMKTRIEGLVLEHSIWHSRAMGGYPAPTPEELLARPPAQHRLVQTHVGSGRKTLYLASHATHVVGWPVDEGKALLKELMDFATRPCFVQSHRWTVGDMLVWDNRCTMHRVAPGKNADKQVRRDLRRTTAREELA